VAGNRIVRDDDHTPVTLRGINRSGMEYQGPSGKEWEEAESDCIVCDWGADILRLPFNQNWALAREGYDAAPYLAALDRAI
jgi:hypothetical protein